MSCATSSDPAQKTERGAVTAEFAIVLPAVIFMLSLLLGAAAVGTSQLQLEEASRLGARAAARGESPETVADIASGIDQHISVRVSEQGGYLEVTASRKAPGIIGQLTGWQLSASATTPAEVQS